MNLIASVHIPNLAIAVARRDEPTLAGAPLILYTAERQRTVVAAASDDTGIAAGTPHTARRILNESTEFARH